MSPKGPPMPARITPTRFWMLVGLALMPASATAQDQTITRARAVPELPDVKTGPPVLTFNGKDLTGFYPYTKDHGYEDPKGVFTVKGGMIRFSGEEYGGLATCGNFGNYHL